MAKPPPEEVRVDRWLVAARLYKSRVLATEACAGGHVRIDGVAVKPSRPLRRGERVVCRTPGGERTVEVVELADRRQSPAIARTLYVDHTPPAPPKPPPVAERERGLGRPTKRERRILDQLKRMGYE